MIQVWLIYPNDTGCTNDIGQLVIFGGGHWCVKYLCPFGTWLLPTVVANWNSGSLQITKSFTVSRSELISSIVLCHLSHVISGDGIMSDKSKPTYRYAGHFKMDQTEHYFFSHAPAYDNNSNIFGWQISALIAIEIPINNIPNSIAVIVYEQLNTLTLTHTHRYISSV